VSSFGENWDRIFGRKRLDAERMYRCPFKIRPGVHVYCEVPESFCVADLRRFVRALGTMCDDWDPEMGLAEIEFRMPTLPTTPTKEGADDSDRQGGR
jgi:hypothetical protein